MLAIDDASVESLWDKYGEWPAPRGVYADIVNYIEQDKPQAIVFDLMFIKSLKSSDSTEEYTSFLGFNAFGTLTPFIFLSKFFVTNVCIPNLYIYFPLFSKKDITFLVEILFIKMSIKKMFIVKLLYET